VIEDDWEEEE